MNQTNQIIKPLVANRSCCRVVLARRTVDIAVKIGPQLPDGDGNYDPFQNEREAMLRLHGHANVIKAVDTTAQSIVLGDGKRYHSLALEVAPHGDLLGYVQLAPFDEILTRTYFKQLLSALKAAHTAGVYHRDLKPENILLSENFTLKLGDFGHAYLCKGKVGGSLPSSESHSDLWISGICGSPGYVAPEVCNTSYYLGSAVDIWSAGCVLFAMLVGHSAFELHYHHPRDKKQDPWLQLLIKGNYGEFWYQHLKFGSIQLSYDAMDLINSMLTVDPATRITLDQVLAHPWLQGPVLDEAGLFIQMYMRSQLMNSSQHASSALLPQPLPNGLLPRSANKRKDVLMPAVSPMSTSEDEGEGEGDAKSSPHSITIGHKRKSTSEYCTSAQGVRATAKKMKKRASGHVTVTAEAPSYSSKKSLYHRKRLNTEASTVPVRAPMTVARISSDSVSTVAVTAEEDMITDTVGSEIELELGPKLKSTENNSDDDYTNGAWSFDGDCADIDVFDFFEDGFSLIP